MVLYLLNPNHNICLFESWKVEDLFPPPEPWFSLKINHKDEEKENKSSEVEEETEKTHTVVRKSWSEFKRCIYCLLRLLRLLTHT